MLRLFLPLLLVISESAFAAPVIVEKSTPATSGNGELVENVGIGTLGGVFTPLLERGCKLPCSATKVFSTADDRQKEIKLSLFRGNAKLAKDAHALGTYVVTKIPPERRGQPQIAITFAVEGDQISLAAVDKKTGRPLEVKRSEL